jgi:hypothetical protein
MAEQHALGSRSDFQRFCAGLRTSSPSLDELVEVLRALEASRLRPLEKGRFAHSIVRHLGERFHPSAVRAVASVTWVPEIAMVLRSHSPREWTPGESGLDEPREPPPAIAVAVPERAPERDPEVELAELSELARGTDSPLTVVFVGDEDEHRPSIDRLRPTGVHCLRESSPAAVREAFEREVVVGLVVGASFWALEEALPRPPRARLRELLELSNTCWTKLVRAPAWAAVEGELRELCTSLYFSEPPRTRLAVEDQAAITNAELRSLIGAAEDLGYAEHAFEYEFQPSVAQDRVIRAATSRYLRERLPAVRVQDAGFLVRGLAHRGEQGLVNLVSVLGHEVSFVVKVSPYRDAREEARRFVGFAHGTGLDMTFFCHAGQGALVFVPIGGTHLGAAPSLESILARREALDESGALDQSAALIDSAIAALERFSRLVQPGGVTTHCTVDYEDTEAFLTRLGVISVAGETVELRWLHAWGVDVLGRASSHAVVHGDAHPGNILFGSNGSAVLIDYECSGLGPACYDLCTLWVHVLASRFVAVIDEGAMVGLCRDLLAGVPFSELYAAWIGRLRFAVNHQVVYLASRAIEASVAVMKKRGLGRADVLGIVAVILCRELYNPGLQQFALRCALAATQAVLRSDPA